MVRTHNGDMGGVRSLTQKALHAMMGKRTVSIQEAVHMIDDLPLIFTSEKITYLSLRKAQVLRSDTDEPATDLISPRGAPQYTMPLYVWAAVGQTFNGSYA